ncbi:unnamed protein product [Prunus brigantina]
MIISGVSISFKNRVLESWRALAFIGLVPCAVTIFGLFFISESPRWLVRNTFLFLFVVILFMILMVLETKGKTLKQIQGDINK